MIFDEQAQKGSSTFTTGTNRIDPTRANTLHFQGPGVNSYTSSPEARDQRVRLRMEIEEFHSKLHTISGSEARAETLSWALGEVSGLVELSPDGAASTESPENMRFCCILKDLLHNKDWEHEVHWMAAHTLWHLGELGHEALKDLGLEPDDFGYNGQGYFVLWERLGHRGRPNL